MKSTLPLLSAMTLSTLLQAAEPGQPRAARSVHLGWPGPEAEIFCNSMVVDRSVPGSYFMACGWDTGYFGIQELGDGKKVIIFSVWDPTKGNDPNKVESEQRVECLFNDPEMRIKRFGGEGTGGQCIGDFSWKTGETNRFLVRAVVEEPKTSYSGFVYQNGQWRKLVTFRTRTDGRHLKGLYSFIEDFRRDFKSAQEARKARFGQGWVRSAGGDWVALARGRFTASGATWEARDSINAGLNENWFFLATGGEIRETLPLRSLLERSVLEVPLPDFGQATDESKSH
ncbi:MAG TPA: DUF3472 domain-containing protein [Verrucomicrobiae bacterium]|nr:DUF3472 domain-containing protein [Verrucomicrobiae bacterium]